ncbi:MAG TPA: L-histidine N(alpha)-methyltransferase [Candidatus Paceibacterota bacterium]|nr:L-histidine N(alpha)-methyltransferase [Candidatus Paceibacterota bacterium]HMO83236.1 L-histidine N(alpha)-methyltransferase [Candidatus Paceibacterota bacterium]
MKPDINLIEKNEYFGPPYAVLNLSKIGLRYFRICILASEDSKERLLENFINHPNIGWVFSAEGWFNIAIGIWAQSNSEINEISAAIRKNLDSKDSIVYQSELTSLHSFGNRPIQKSNKPMTIVDSVQSTFELNHTELDYLKVITLDSSIPDKEMSEILGITEEVVLAMKNKLTKEGIIVGYQERVNYGGIYFKVFIDSLSRKSENSLEELLAKLWKDVRCIYVERANGKYDVEFEVILDTKDEIEEFLSGFSDYQSVILTKNLYTNLYPLSKVANIKQIKDTLSNQIGPVIDFRNSKLWYLNHKGTDAYLNIYDNKKYFEVMEKSELDLFDEIISYLKKDNDGVLFSVIDIGSGDGLKGRVFIEKIGEESVKAYYPVDVQPIELAAALRANVEGKYAKHPVLLDIENLTSRFPLKLIPGEKQIFVFFGGTYGNFKSEIINRYLNGIVKDPSIIFLVTMPIVAESQSELEIIDSYANPKIEDIFFGPLLQLGFKKTDFEKNVNKPGLHAQVAIEEKRLVSSFILKETITLSGRSFEKGTVFKMTSSWKPTLNEFEEALATDFVVEKIFNNDSMSIALIKSKPQTFNKHDNTR